MDDNFIKRKKFLLISRWRVDDQKTTKGARFRLSKTSFGGRGAPLEGFDRVSSKQQVNSDFIEKWFIKVNNFEFIEKVNCYRKFGSLYVDFYSELTYTLSKELFSLKQI